VVRVNHQRILVVMRKGGQVKNNLLKNRLKAVYSGSLGPHWEGLDASKKAEKDAESSQMEKKEKTGGNGGERG